MKARSTIAETLLEYHHGLHLRGSVLWLDPPQPQPLAFVSHALSPGALDHQKALCTERTARLLSALAGVYGRGRRAHQPQSLVSPYGRSFKLGQLKLEMLPSGYTLGAASLRIQYRGFTMVYAGRVRVDRGAFSPRLEARPCQLLVLPGPLFDVEHQPRAAVEASLRRFVTEAVAAERTVVLFCSPVGEAQELTQLLSGIECPLWAHRQIVAVHQVFRESFPDLTPVSRLPSKPPAGGIVLWPCRLHRSPTLGRLGPRTSALVSASALDPLTRAAVAADAAFPLSLYSDRSGLLELVRACDPQEVVLEAGEGQQLQRELEEMGIQVHRLGPPRQMALF